LSLLFGIRFPSVFNYLITLSARARTFGGITSILDLRFWILDSEVALLLPLYLLPNYSVCSHEHARGESLVQSAWRFWHWW